MDQAEETLGNIRAYWKDISPDFFPAVLKERATLVLSGSTGWGIEEGFDTASDWDMHILLADDDYTMFVARHGKDYVIDDHVHSPIVFGQIHDRQWLIDRMENKKPGSWPLYLWIYTRCRYIQDPLGVEQLVSSYQAKFEAELEAARKAHFITFSVRRLDTSSSAKRGIVTATGINKAEMVKAALQTYSLIRGQPYPYNKWLAKHVMRLGSEGESLVRLCEESLLQTDKEQIVQTAKRMRDFLEDAMRKAVGDQRWITKWWEFNEN